MDFKNCFSLAIFFSLNNLLFALVSAQTTNPNCPTGPTPPGVPNPPGVPGGPTPTPPGVPTPLGVSTPTPPGVPTPTPPGVPTTPGVPTPTPPGVSTPPGVPSFPPSVPSPVTPMPPSGPTPSPPLNPACPNGRNQPASCNALLNAVQNNATNLPSPGWCCSNFSNLGSLAAECICGSLRNGNIGGNPNFPIYNAFQVLSALCSTPIPPGFTFT